MGCPPHREWPARGTIRDHVCQALAHVLVLADPHQLHVQLQRLSSVPAGSLTNSVLILFGVPFLRPPRRSPGFDPGIVPPMTTAS